MKCRERKRLRERCRVDTYRVDGTKKNNKVWKNLVKLWKQTFTGFPISIIATKLVVKNSIDIDYS